MGKPLIWVGIALAVVGVALGFVKAGDCGSVFAPRDQMSANVDRLLGQTVSDCSNAMNLTPVVWALIGVGVVLAVVGLVTLPRQP